MARRAGWGFADQALSSLTNFAIAIVAAHESTPRTFGLFALVFATFSLALGACRAICCEPLSVRYSGASKSEWRVGAAMATGTALAVGTIVGLGCGAVGLVIGGQSRDLLLILGVSLPGLLLQDAWRYAFFAAGSGARAFANDGVCAFLLLLALVVLLAQGHVAVDGLLALWGAAAAVAAIFGVWQSGLMPSPLRLALWWRRQSDLALRFLAEFVGLTGEYQAMFYAIAAVTGLATVAAVRGGMLLLGPMNILGYGAMIAGVPEAVRLLKGGSRRLLLLSGVVSGGLMVVTLLWASLILLLPTRLGVSAIGSVWYTARPLIVPLALGLAMLGAVMGAVISLRALAAARRSLRARLVVSPVVLAAGLVGAALHGASGAAWGIAFGNSFAAFVFWYHLVRAVSEHRDLSPAGKDDRQPADKAEGASRTMIGPAAQPS
jgi:hypothetical protein